MKRVIAIATVLTVVASTAQAGTVFWSDATDVSAATDVVVLGESVEAINGGTSSPSVNGQTFTGATPVGGSASGLFSGNTGSATYNTLLTEVDFGGGGGTTSISVGAGSLVAGETYLIQVWFTDDRSGSNSRVMTFGDGSGNTVDLKASATASVGVPGQYATGQFVATDTSQTLTLTPNGFGNSHINAFQVRTAGPANGSFELDSTWEVGSDFDFTPDNWNVTGQVFLVSPSRSNVQVRTINATDGSQALQFNGGNLASGGAIDQDFATIAGQAYVLTFDFGKKGAGAGAASLDLFVTDGSGVGGTLLQMLSIDDATDGALAFYGTAFTADSDVTNLRFLDSTAGAGLSFDGWLDNIRLTPIVPSPAALPAGLALMTLVAARRRRAAGRR